MADLDDLTINDSGFLEVPTKTSTDTVVELTSTGSGNWTVPTGVSSIKLLVLAGGGGGGSGTAGGGGAGGLVSIPSYPVTPGASIPYTVGAGAASVGRNGGFGAQGQNSTFGSITAIGGGGGGSGHPGRQGNGADGGSGGGGDSYPTHSSDGGVATQARQPGDSGYYGHGFPGSGSASTGVEYLNSALGTVPGARYEIGGGGGAGGPGYLNYGGPGRADSITGSLVYRGGGGGGQAGNSGSQTGPGRGGGGGRSGSTGLSGGTNLGGGGGGGWDYGSGTGGAGGPGTIIIRYNTDDTATVGDIRHNNNDNTVEVYSNRGGDAPPKWTPVPGKLTTFSTVGSSHFVVPDGVTSVHVLVVGGGGSGGSGTGGGGGAGGMVEHFDYPVSPGQKIPVTVGGGGPTARGVRSPGEPSMFGSLEALGGGGGAWDTNGGNGQVGAPGGSGGGNTTYTGPANGTGAGRQPAMPSIQGAISFGFPGGTATTANYGGGGGGAGGAGGGNPREGGPGRSSSITGTPVFYAGGGGGGATGSGGAGGAGGGGRGNTSPGGGYTPGTDGLGGGGGGGWNHNSSATGAGGSGIVIVKH